MSTPSKRSRNIRRATRASRRIMPAPTPIISAPIRTKPLSEADALLADRPARSLLPRAEGSDPARRRPAQRKRSRRCARRSTRSDDAPLIAAMLGHALIATEDPKNFAEAKQVLKTAVNRDNENPFAWYQLGIIYDREGDRPRAALATAERNNLEGDPKLALASAEMAMKGIPAGHAGLSSRAGYRHGVRDRAEEERQEVARTSDRREAASALWWRRSRAGSSARLLTAGAAVLRRAAVCQQQDRAPGTARRPANPHRSRSMRFATRQYAPTLAGIRAALETPFASRGKARPSPRSRWSNSSIMPAPIARRATRTSSGCSRRIRAFAWSIASFRSSARKRQAAARSRWPHQGRPVPPIPRRALRRRASGADTIAAAARIAGHLAQPPQDPAVESRAQTQHAARRPARRDRHAAVRGRRPGDERRGRLCDAQEGHRGRPEEELRPDTPPIAGDDRRSRRRSARSMVDYRQCGHCDPRRGRPRTSRMSIC